MYVEITTTKPHWAYQCSSWPGPYTLYFQCYKIWTWWTKIRTRKYQISLVCLATNWVWYLNHYQNMYVLSLPSAFYTNPYILHLIIYCRFFFRLPLKSIILGWFLYFMCIDIFENWTTFDKLFAILLSELEFISICHSVSRTRACRSSSNYRLEMKITEDASQPIMPFAANINYIQLYIYTLCSHVGTVVNPLSCRQ